MSGTAAADSSTGPHVVSVYVPAGGNAVVLTALASGSRDCWGIVDIKTPLTTALDNEEAVGTYYFVVKNSSPSTCIAGSVSPTAANTLSAAFPAG